MRLLLLRYNWNKTDRFWNRWRSSIWQYRGQWYTWCNNRKHYVTISIRKYSWSGYYIATIRAPLRIIHSSLVSHHVISTLEIWYLRTHCDLINAKLPKAIKVLIRRPCYMFLPNHGGSRVRSSSMPQSTRTRCGPRNEIKGSLIRVIMYIVFSLLFLIVILSSILIQYRELVHAKHSVIFLVKQSNAGQSEQ